MALTVTKAALQPEVEAGSNLAWRIVVSNPAGRAVTGATVVDDLPQGLTYVSSSTSGATCAAEGQEVTCTLTNTIRTRESVTIDLATAVSQGTAAQLVNTVSLFVAGNSVVAHNQASAAVAVETSSVPATLAFTGSTIGNLLGAAIIALSAGTLLIGARRGCRRR